MSQNWTLRLFVPPDGFLAVKPALHYVRLGIGGVFWQGAFLIADDLLAEDWEEFVEGESQRSNREKEKLKPIPPPAAPG